MFAKNVLRLVDINISRLDVPEIGERALPSNIFSCNDRQCYVVVGKYGGLLVLDVLSGRCIEISEYRDI